MSKFRSRSGRRLKREKVENFRKKDSPLTWNDITQVYAKYTKDILSDEELDFVIAKIEDRIDEWYQWLEEFGQYKLEDAEAYQRYYAEQTELISMVKDYLNRSKRHEEIRKRMINFDTALHVFHRYNPILGRILNIPELLYNPQLFETK